MTRGVTDPADREYLAALGRRMKLIRGARDLNQATIADRAHLDRVYVSRLESGLHNPTTITVLHLARALSVPLSLLLDDEATSLKFARLLGNLPDD